MTFDAIPAGASLFVDANPIIYAVTSDPKFGPACQSLLQRIENQEIQGFTSAHVVAEMAHRLMTIEASSMLGRPLTGMANWLKRHPREVMKLSRFRQAVDELNAIPIQVLPISGALVPLAADLCPQHGLLMNDALVVVVMRHHAITHLASLDTDFDAIPGLVRCAPA